MFKLMKVFSFGILLCFLIGCGAAGPSVAKIEELGGEAKYMAKSTDSFSTAEVGKEMCNGGAVKTTAGAFVNLEFLQDKTAVKVGENTYFEIKDFTKKELKQMGGVEIYNVSPQDTELTVETPHGMATVLGTVFRLDVTATYTQLIVEKGTVQFGKGNTKVRVEAGKFYSTALPAGEEAQIFDPFELDKLFSGKELKQNYNLR